MIDGECGEEDGAASPNGVADTERVLVSGGDDGSTSSWSVGSPSERDRMDADLTRIRWRDEREAGIERARVRGMTTRQSMYPRKRKSMGSERQRTGKDNTLRVHVVDRLLALRNPLGLADDGSRRRERSSGARGRRRAEGEKRWRAEVGGVGRRKKHRRTRRTLSC